MRKGWASTKKLASIIDELRRLVDEALSLHHYSGRFAPLLSMVDSCYKDAKRRVERLDEILDELHGMMYRESCGRVDNPASRIALLVDEAHRHVHKLILEVHELAFDARFIAERAPLLARLLRARRIVKRSRELEREAIDQIQFIDWEVNHFALEAALTQLWCITIRDEKRNDDGR